MPRRTTRISPYDRYLKAVEQEHGEAPVNPFKLARLDHEFGVQEFATLVGVSKQALIRLEQGCNPEPIAKVLDFFVDSGMHSYVQLTNDYEEFQYTLRRRHRLLFGNPKYWTFTASEHPFLTLRNSWSLPPVGNLEPLGVTMNTTEAAKLLCVNQSTLLHWEEKVSHQAIVPKAFWVAMQHAGYGTDSMSRIDRAFTKHRQWRLNGDKDRIHVSTVDKVREAILHG